MQHHPSQDPQDQTMFSPLGSQSQSGSGAHPPVNGASAPAIHATQARQPSDPIFFYTQGDDLDLSAVDEQDAPSSPLVMPFQPSSAMPTVGQLSTGHARRALGTTPPPSSLKRAGQARAFPLVMILLIVGLLVITLAIGGIFVFAQPAAPPVPTQGSGMKTGPTGGAFPTAHTSMPKPTATQPAAVTSTLPHSPQETQGTGTQPVAGLPTLALLDQLGWTHAGLSLADAIEAQRTATTFVDREMSYDYRTIGTPDQHGGSLTNSTFLLTPGGQVRFIHHDVRMINNTLYNTIRAGQIIQQVVGAQAMLVTFQVMTIGGHAHQFAWLSVSFELLRSSIDPATGKRVEGIEQERASGQPRLHHMSVVLVRVAPQTQGTGAPMGGTGWLVNIYALDATTLPAIATAPSL